jgi:1-acyl-sn-glycerol-3-phosphate acyltransferase
MNKITFYLKLIHIALVIFYYGIKSIFADKSKHEAAFHKVAKQWGNKILKIANVKLEIIGKKNLDDKGNYVFTANHSSMFDIPISMLAIDNPFRIIYKKELEKIFIFGTVMKKSPYIPIIRENSKNAMAGVQQAIEAVKNGTSVLIYPEGTRSDDGNLGEFKRGGFMLASRSGKPIVPVTIINSRNILPKGQLNFTGGVVKVIIDKPIEIPENITKKEEVDLMAQVRGIILNNLEKYSN